MYRILTGICCVVWCAAITLQAMKLQPTGKDVNAAAAYFTEEMPGETSALICLSGSCPRVLSEEEIPEFLETAAAGLGIQSGYGVFEKQEENGCIWELSGADTEKNYSLKYLCSAQKEGFVSWRLSGDWSQQLQEVYYAMENLQKQYSIEGMVCLELTGVWDTCLTEEEIGQSAKKLLKAIGSEAVFEEQQDNLQLYYGYGEALGDSVKFDGEEANVNLMYRTNDTQTRCILGFPVVLWDE